MGIQKEIWTSHIQANLFRNNEFLNHAFIADQYVLQGKVVHIPNANGTPTITKNRTSLPATVVQRTDIDITYQIDEYSSEPLLIPNADTVELAYDKLNSVLGEMESSIRQVVGDNMLYNWANSLTGSSIVRTSGAAVAAHLPGATGTRKLLTLADIKAARLQMNKWNIPNDDRFICMDADSYDQLMNELNITTYRESSKDLDLPAGVIGRIYGFNIMERSSVLVASSATTPSIQTIGAATNTGDNAVALVWQKNTVERALGTIDFFENIGDPTYYGDIYSALVRMGGRKRRNDMKGIIAIIQSP